MTIQVIDPIKIQNCAKAIARGSRIDWEDLAQSVVVKLLESNYPCTNYFMYVKHRFLDMLRMEQTRVKHQMDWEFLYKKANPDLNNLILLRQAEKEQEYRYTHHSSGVAYKNPPKVPSVYTADDMPNMKRHLLRQHMQKWLKDADN